MVALDQALAKDLTSHQDVLHLGEKVHMLGKKVLMLGWERITISGGLVHTAVFAVPRKAMTIRKTMV